AVPAARRSRTAGFGRAAVALTALGWLAHLGSLTYRGLAVGRVPWGNMYEFAVAVCLVAVTAYLVLLVRQPIRYLGVFVMLPVVLLLGLAGTVLYVRPAPLVPALNSYWLKIHVTAAVLATGIFLVGFSTSVLYLIRERYERRVAAGRPVGFPTTLGVRLPAADALERVTFRVIAFAFPIWTFAVIAGAIWAEAAWGRYWGWDPKETWAFIAWVIYAAYLHARSTAGWRGRAAVGIALLGWGAMMFNLFGVNILISGLHSYAGL
ncbi:MAG: c-type cytochrome biogenesis protein CcsB, partial [Actinomycetota bacterium]|nr:c-type cytochrome biogenesis protein CcsB [Actinomycetota bacterium]